MIDALVVWTQLDGRPFEVGRLELHEDTWSLGYNPAWLAAEGRFPISRSLPLRPEPWSGAVVRRWFANLLPEGAARRAVAQRLGISEDNDWALLVALGGDCAGALSLLPPDRAPPDPAQWAYEPLGDADLARIARRDVVPLLVGERTVRLSLAGAQDKLPIAMLDGAPHLPLASAPSTHILKLPSRDFAHLSVNEAFVTELGAASGLPVVESSLFEATDPPCLLVRRFDRASRPGAWPVARLHQEDLCQALGLPPARKYQAEGGPSLANLVDIVRRSSSLPLVDVQAVLDWTVFNVVAGNADAHGKNVAFVRRLEGVRLAPFHDLVSTRLYPRLDRQLALAVGPRQDMDALHAADWHAMADAVDMGRRVVSERVEAAATRVLDALALTVRTFVERHGPQAVLQTLPRAIERRARALIRRLR